MFRRGCESPPQTWSVVANFSATFMASPAFTASLLRAPFPRLDNKLLSKLDQWAQIPLSGGLSLLLTDPRRCQAMLMCAHPSGHRPNNAFKPKSLRSAKRMARSEEHTSELQSLMRISYAVFCLKKKTKELRSERTRRQLRH